MFISCSRRDCMTFEPMRRLAILNSTKWSQKKRLTCYSKQYIPMSEILRTHDNQCSIARDIAREPGHLAIALNQAGATIRRKIYTLEKYLRSYLGKRHRLLNSKSISLEGIDVIATWEIPFRRIETIQSME